MQSAVVLIAFLIAGCGSAVPSPQPSTSTPPVQAGVWTGVEGFPAEETLLGALSGDGGDGFLIAGSTAAADEDCPKRRDAVIWSSANGGEWRLAAIADAANAVIDVLARDASGWLAVGREGSDQCPGAGPVAWTSADRATWERVTTAGLGRGDRIVDVVALDQPDVFLATGYADGEEDAMGVWSVRVDGAGSHWTRVRQPPPMSRRTALSNLASRNGAVVGFDRTPTLPAWLSIDAGQSWTNSKLRTPYLLTPTSSAAVTDGFLASGRACCGVPTQIAGTLLSSIDGQDWKAAPGPRTFAKPVEAMASSPARLVAIGEETYISSGGSDWRIGPALPGYEPRDYRVNGAAIPFRLTAAAAGDWLVAMTPGRAWYASLADLDPSRWPEQAPEAEMPVLATPYPYRLFTHCGPTNGSLQFGFRGWVPDLPSGSFPLSYDSYYEQGSLKLVADDQLDFTGRAGEVVSYHPTDDPPPSFPCA